MMSFLRSLKGSWYLGKGNKAFKNGYYDQALSCFLSALEYAQKAENYGELAVRKEAIAETYIKLERYDKAKLYASESLDIYEKYYSKNNSDVFKNAVSRVTKLLVQITYREKGA